MCLKIFEISFLIIGLALSILLISRQCGVTKNMDGMKASVFITIIAIFFLAYIFNTIILSILIPDLYTKLIMAFIAISPFIIGKLVTYPKVGFYSNIQIGIVILSIGYLLVYMV